MQQDVLLPSGLAALVCALPHRVPAVPAVMPAALVWHMAGPSEEGPAAVCLGETQKILGQATGKVKQTIYFQAEQSDESVSV